MPAYISVQFPAHPSLPDVRKRAVKSVSAHFGKINKPESSILNQWQQQGMTSSNFILQHLAGVRLRVLAQHAVYAPGASKLVHEVQLSTKSASTTPDDQVFENDNFEDLTTDAEEIALDMFSHLRKEGFKPARADIFFTTYASSSKTGVEGTIESGGIWITYLRLARDKFWLPLAVLLFATLFTGLFNDWDWSKDAFATSVILLGANAAVFVLYWIVKSVRASFGQLEVKYNVGTIET